MSLMLFFDEIIYNQPGEEIDMIFEDGVSMVFEDDVDMIYEG